MLCRRGVLRVRFIHNDLGHRQRGEIIEVTLASRGEYSPRRRLGLFELPGTGAGTARSEDWRQNPRFDSKSHHLATGMSRLTCRGFAVARAPRYES